LNKEGEIQIKMEIRKSKQYLEEAAGDETVMKEEEKCVEDVSLWCHGKKLKSCRLLSLISRGAQQAVTFSRFHHSTFYRARSTGCDVNARWKGEISKSSKKANQ